MKKALKRSLSLLLAITIIMGSAYVGLAEVDWNSLFTVRAKAASESDLTFTLNDDGKSYFVDDCDNYASGNLIIPSTYDGLPVTSIDSFAFEYCKSLTSITIPSSVTSVIGNAFYSCTSLSSINVDLGNTYYISIDGVLFNKDKTTIMKYPARKQGTSYSIPDSVTSIGVYAFDNSTGLNSITIPDSVISIGGGAFYNCTSLNSITIPDSVTSMGVWAFYNCTSLNSITIPDGVTSIDCNAFENCTNLTDITIPDSAVSIGSSAFYNTGYYNNSANWVNDILCIGNHLIEAKTTLSGEYAIKNGLKFIACNAFDRCINLTSITIPDSVTSIGEYAFYNCTSLNAVHITDVSAWCMIVFGNSASNPLYYAKNLYLNSELVTDLVIPDSVTSIGKYAFYNCTSLVTVTIPDSTTTIVDYAFRGCSNLDNVFYTGTVEAAGKIVIGKYNDELLNNVIHYEAADHTYGEYVYDYSNNTKTCECTVCGYALTEKLANVNYLTFTLNDDGTAYSVTDCDASATDELIIPNNYNGLPVTSIGSSAFQDCTSLTSITIPDSVTSIGNSAFYGCTSLTSINIPNGIKNIGGWAFSYCSSLTSITIPDGVSYINSNTFLNCKNLKTIVIPDSVTSIGSGAFGGCSSLTSITIPDNVTSIGGSAFGGCTRLTSITIPYGVTSIADYTFTGCTSLKSIVIPSSVTSIGYGTFSDCSRLAKITIPDSVTYIGPYAFDFCTSLISISIGNSVTSIGHYAFEGCTSLTYIRIPNSVTTIYDCAFFGCESLTSITIPKSVTSISGSAFGYCTSLKDVYYIGTQADWANIAISSGNDCLLTAFIHYHEHTYSDWIIDKEATCDSYGSKYRKCSTCGETETGVIPTLEHNYDYEYVLNPDNENECLKEYKCNDCDATIFGDETYIAVRTVDDLRNIDNNLTASYVLMNDIDLTEATAEGGKYDFNGNGWKPIGNDNSSSGSFSGVLDGNGYKIIGMRIDDSGTSSKKMLGLFGSVTGTVENLSVSGSIKVSGLNNVRAGAICGFAKDAVIRYCSSYCKVELSPTTDAHYAGGIVGMAENSTQILQCYNRGDVSGFYSGGIVGYWHMIYFNASGKVSNCYNTGKISGTSPAGIVGYSSDYYYTSSPNFTELLIENCYNRGNFNGSGTAIVYIQTAKTTTVSNCYYLNGLCDAQTGAVALSESDMQLKDSYDGFDFTSIWFIEPSTGYPYPQLRNNPHRGGCAHIYSDWVVDTEATCEADGSKYRTCESCGEVETEVIPATGHDCSTEWMIGKNATCTKSGYKYHHCYNCGKRTDETEIAATGHTFGDWHIEHESTCEIVGLKNRECTACGEAETEVIPATGHDYSTEWTIDIPATCTKPGSKSHHCLICDYQTDIYYIAALGHIVGEWVVTTEPTCSQEGEKTGYCGTCGEACATEAVPTTEHNYDYDNYEYVANPDNSAEVVREHKCKDCDATTLGEETYIAVRTASDLRNIDNDLKANYVMMNDIDLTEETSEGGIYDYMCNGWKPIGGNEKYSYTSFSGTFDGNGYEIVGLRIYATTPPKNYTGQIYLGLFSSVSGTIKNLTISGIIGSSVSNDKYVGGIASRLSGGTIENCHSNCKMNISNGRNDVGGIVGYATGTNYYIFLCSNENIVVGEDDAGGIVGECEGKGVISQCLNIGEIHSSRSGGIVGHFRVSSGYNLEVYNSYNNGMIYGAHVSGVCGVADSSPVEDSVYFEYCYNHGILEGSSSMNAMIYPVKDSMVDIVRCYYLDGCGSKPYGATALSEDLMRVQSAYSGFDFNDIWFIDDSTGYPYPQLRNNPHRGGCAHIYSDWIVDLEPTCEADGSKHRTCSSCNEVETEVIPATGHDYSTDWTIDVPATCTTDGSKSHHCNNCGDKADVTEIIAPGHIVGEWVVTTEPTCSQEGEKVGYCAECGEVCATEAVPTTEHNYNYDNYEYVQNPENPDEYHKQYECEDCGSTKVDENPVVIKSLIIESLPDKTTYVEGQAIDTTGLVVKLEFEDGTTEAITDYDIVYDNSVTGEQDVTVSFGNVTAFFKVTFTAKNLVSIAVTKMPDKTTYVIGDTFDRTGMVVTATYDNGITEEVTGYTVSTLPQNVGKKNLMVLFGGKRVIIQVTVIEKKADSMTVIDPEKFEYVLGDEFDPTGMVVTVTFNNGAVEEVTDYTIEGFGDFTGVGYITLKYENLSYEIAILMHAPADFWVVETEATCSADGLKHLYCTECCEIARTEIIPATGHDYAETVIKQATCLEEGTKKFDCKYCDSSYIENYGGEHVISGEKVTLEPTCGADGVKYNLCSVCGETVGQPILISALGHDYSTKFTVDVEATCSQPGSMSRHCSRCDAKTDVTVIESSVHDYTDWVVTTPAGCETDGERTRSCTGCGEYFTETIAAPGHAYSIIWTTDKTPTCTVDGSKSHHCNRCGDKKDITVIPATGHTFGEWVLLEEATCTVNGQRVRMCSTCYMEDVEILTAPGHTYNEWTVDAKADCENDGARHTNCTVCGTVVNETIKAYGHDYQSVFTVDVEATCTEAGSKSHHCSRCESKTDVTVIQPLGHHISTMWTIDKDPTCESEGLKSHHCLRCDCVEDVTTIPVANHIYGKWYVVTPATMDTAGVRAHKCYNCEMTEEAELPKLLKYTATFVADGDVVATVDFPEDATEIEIPEVPHKDKFNGEWENFDIRNKNFTVNAVYTPIPANEVEGIKTGNTADYYASTGEVEVNLNVSAPSRTIVTTTTKTVPLDIVFVLDQSGSMAEYGRKDALKSAVRSFSDAILDDAKKYSVDHRIAVVGFASGNNYGLNYANTELLTSSEVRYDNIKNSDYADSLVSVNNNGALNNVITKAINAIDAEGATRADIGLEMATNIFANNPVTDNRQRVVVFLTDGVPTSYSNFEYNVANVAIQNAYQLKNTYDATVYSVGVFDRGTSADSKVNNFMNYVSSNYSEDVVMSKYSKETTENIGGYYLDVSDVSKLSDVFTSIVEETTTHTGRFTKATLKYTLTNNFVLTINQENAIRKDAVEKLGVTNEQISITRNDNGTTTIVISDVEPWASGTNYVIDFTFRATANGNTLKSGTYQVGTFESGVILENGEGYEAVFAPQSVDIGGTSGIAVFNINNLPYAINRLSSTTKVVAPATDFGADYNFIGWNVPNNLTLNNEARVFEAELLKNEYKLSWNIDGEITEVKYAVGDFITVPHVGNNSIGGAFVGWDMDIPETMPSENLTITAIYDAHYHKYDVTKAFESCTEGGTLTYTCECGHTYTEEIAPCEHNWEVITASNNQNAIENAGSRCSVCGIKDSKALRLEGKSTYQMADASYNTATVELDYIDENGDKHQPDGNVEISVQLDEVFTNEIPADATATVYRVNDDGSRTILNSEQKGMQMTFTTDHFSTYEFEFTTGTQKYLFAQPKSRIDYTNRVIFSDIRLARDFKDFVSYLAPATVDENADALGFMGTGTSITMQKDGVDTEYTVVINGDTNGDSVVDALDAAQVALVTNGQKTIDGAYKMAADSNLDDEISIEDYQAIVNKVVA